jgi:hypothetical protein
LIAKTGREAAKRGLDFEPQVNTEINRVLAGKPKHKSSTGLRGKVARAAGEHIVSYAKKKNMGVTSAERTPVNYRRADIKLKASDRDVAMVSLKIMQRQRNGSLRSPTERNSTVHSVANEMGTHSAFLGMARDGADKHKGRIKTILAGKSYDAIKTSTHPKMKATVDAVKKQSHHSRAKIANNLRYHMSLMKPEEIHSFLHTHLHGGDLIPLPHIQYLAVLHPDKQDEVLHSLSEPKKTFQHVMNRYGSTLHVNHRKDSMVTRVHVHALDPISGNKVTVATLQVTDKGRPHRTPDVITTTKMPQLAARIRKATSNQ